MGLAKKFLYPKFNGFDIFFIRIGGSGLGNLLFVYAYAIKKQKSIPGSILIEPTWNCIKPKWTIKGDFSRNYISIVNYDKWFQNTAMKIMLHFRLISKDRFEIVHGMQDRFDGLKCFNDELKSILLAKLSTKQREIYQKFSSKFIGIHIRTGDFQANHKDVNKPIKKSNEQIPLAWFEKCIQCLGSDNQIIIFTDAKKNSNVMSLSRYSNVQFFSATKNPLTTILVMSRSSIFIGSNSSFSGWASYLGQMPVWYFPGTKNALTCGSSVAFELSYAEINRDVFKV